jgi:hypothetical protein
MTLMGRTTPINSDCPLEYSDASLHVVLTEWERKELKMALS